jgi:hypothetical protein
MRCFVVASTGLWPATVRGDAKVTLRLAQRFDRGPAARPTCPCRCGRRRAFRVVCDASGESVDVRRSQTTHRRASADCAATCARKRRPLGECSMAGGGRRQAPKASSWVGVTLVKVLCADWGHAAFPTSTGAGLPADDRGVSVRPVRERITVDVRACRSGRTCRIGAKR